MSVPRQVYAGEAPFEAIPIDQRVRLPPQVIRHILRGDHGDAKPGFFYPGIFEGKSAPTETAPPTRSVQFLWERL
ncbi:hypothetical protein PPTS312_47220 [Pseudomonas putida]|uniref:Uncharacterized protein n=1 Tax=Pseudomonas putida TaxID=303 RepID=A0A7U6M6C6_PSEPU|nr:hypothetical protein PPTS312_47220 [Pseudomonas putida]